MKKFVYILMSIGIIATSTPAISTIAAENIKVKVDGMIVDFPDAQPFVNSDNRTMIPVRSVSEALGCKVDWDEETETVEITQETKHILLEIGKKEAQIKDGSISYKKEIDTQPEIKNDRTFVPLRFVSENLGANVTWDESVNTVMIKSKVETTTPTTPVTSPAVNPTPTPAPTEKIPVPTGEPSFKNPIPGNPYYIDISKEDVSRFTNLQGLLKYDDIIAIAGDSSNGNLLTISYGCYNKYQKRYQGYLSVDAKNNYFSWKISISKYGEKEIQRLHEVINIAVPGSQEFKDYVYNTAIEARMTSGTALKEFEGQKFYVSGFYNDGTKPIWEDESFFVTIWGMKL